MIYIRASIRNVLDNPYNVFYGFSLIMFFFGFALAPPDEIISGLIIIINSPDILITDYIEIAGIGAAFVNSGIVMAMSVAVLVVFKHSPSRFTVTTLLLAGGFAFFGKNPVNILPILLGGFLFSLYAKEPFHNNVLATLLGTTLSPAVSALAFVELPGKNVRIHAIIIGIIIGVVIGFIIEPIAKNSMKSHEGYNLYNVGFAAGILGVVIMSIFRSFGIDFRPVNILSSGYGSEIALFIFCISAYFLFVGYMLTEGLEDCIRIMFSYNEIGDYFRKIESVEYMQMGIIGIIVTCLLTFAGIELNGPIIGGIFTIVGFSCSGKKLRNIAPVMVGATVAGYLNIYQFDSTVVVMAILFSTCLSPIAENFGWYWGGVAGFMHMAVSLNVGIVNGGLNLYNNGLAGGFVVMTLVPLIRAFTKRKKITA